MSLNHKHPFKPSKTKHNMSSHPPVHHSNFKSDAITNHSHDKQSSPSSIATSSNPLPLPTPLSNSIATNSPPKSSSPSPPSMVSNGGTILTGSSLPAPAISSPPSSSSSPQETLLPSSPSSASSMIGPILGSVAVVVLLLSLLLYGCYQRYQRRIKQKGIIAGNPHQYQYGQRHHQPYQHRQTSHHDGGWNLTRSWSTLGSTTSSKCTVMDIPPPTYYSSTQMKDPQKRWTQDSFTSKPPSLVKQYSPQLAYSPSDHSILHMDQHNGGVSPSHTLVDTTGGNSWLNQKELHLEEHQETEQTERRRSIQPYQAQLDLTSPFSDAVTPPGPYDSGMLLHTNEFQPSSTS